MSTAPPVLEIRDLVAGYSPELDILSGVSIRVLAGEIVTVVGPNGAGKSTLMKAVIGLLAPRNGRVSLRELAEEELLLALPIVPACNSPQSCGRAPSHAAGDETTGVTGDMRRPFSALQDLLKKT